MFIQRFLNKPLVIAVRVVLACTTVTQSTHAVNFGQQWLNAKQTARCNMKASQSPLVHGLRIGMNVDQVIVRLVDPPKVSALSTFVTGNEALLDINDKLGNLAIRASRAQFGVRVIDVYSNYLKQRSNNSAKEVDLENLNFRLSLVFLDKRLTGIGVDYGRTARWSNLDEFLSGISKAHGFSLSWWRLLVTGTASANAPEHADFQSPVQYFECNGLRITASCVGPPAPPGMCDSSGLVIWKHVA